MSNEICSIKKHTLEERTFDIINECLSNFALGDSEDEIFDYLGDEFLNLSKEGFTSNELQTSLYNALTDEIFWQTVDEMVDDDNIKKNVKDFANVLIETFCTDIVTDNTESPTEELGEQASKGLEKKVANQRDLVSRWFGISKVGEQYVEDVLNEIRKICYFDLNEAEPEFKDLNNIKGAYHGCTSLQTIDIPNNVKNIRDYAFIGCTSLQHIDIPNSVKSIGKGAFLKCISIQSIDIPNSVESIRKGAFAGCASLQSIDIPNSINNIGNGAFAGCVSLKSIEIPHGVKSIGDSTFCNCTSLQSIDIPNNVTRIGNAAFSWCSSLKSIDIPNNVKSIGEYTFIGCTSLKSVDISNSVKTIKKEAFRECTSLQSIDIPSSVKSIENKVFNVCTSLQSINVSKDNPNYASVNGVLYNKDLSCIIKVPIGKNFDSFNLSNGVTNIGKNAFAGCSSLKSIEIPSSVENIGDEAFVGCESLQSINIPNSVKCIGNQVFGRCDYPQGYHVYRNIGCASLHSIHLNYQSLENVDIEKEAFPEELFKTCTLYIPSGTRWEYRHHPVFGKFEKIEIEKKQ